MYRVLNSFEFWSMFYQDNQTLWSTCFFNEGKKRKASFFEIWPWIDSTTKYF